MSMRWSDALSSFIPLFIHSSIFAIKEYSIPLSCWWRLWSIIVFFSLSHTIVLLESPLVKNAVNVLISRIKKWCKLLVLFLIVGTSFQSNTACIPQQWTHQNGAEFSLKLAKTPWTQDKVLFKVIKCDLYKKAGCV